MKSEIATGEIAEKRTTESHFDDIENADSVPHYKGVSFGSVLLELEEFEIDDLPHDPMHIILEGLAKYHCIDLFQRLLDGLDGNRTSIDEINLRLKYFDYGNKSRNKPLPIQDTILNDKTSLRWTAAMTWTFTMFSPFILEDIVDTEHEDFKFFNLLRKICLICFANEISNEALEKLDLYIKEYVERYLRANTLSNVPKLHYLTHLVEQIKR